MTSTVKVKAGSTTITRRFEINSDCSWDELNLQVRRLFDLQGEFTLKYLDDEDELITLGTHGELEEALKIIQKTGLLRLFVESPDQRATAGIESFRDLLGETPREITAAPKRKFLFNSSAPSEPSSAFKTAKMDDSEISEAVTLTPSSQGATYTTSSAGFELGSPSQQSKVQSSGKSSEVADEGIDDADVWLIEQITSSSGQPPINRPGDMPMSTPMSGEQYTPLVQLMVPPPSSVPPPRPPPPSAKPRKNPKGRKGKGCYSQLAENVAVELASMNERLHQKLRSSFEMLQAKENDAQELGELEEDSYVFVNQQGNLMAPNEDMNVESEVISSSPMQHRETEEDSLDDDTPCSPENSLASDGNASDLHNVDHASIEQAVHRVVQESLPRIVEQTLRNLQGLHLDDQSSSSPVQVPGKQTGSKVVHKGIFCAECNQAVTGVRYKCCFCTDYDLCEDCEAKDGIHDPNHFFAKLRSHIPGIGRKNGEMIPVLKKFVYRTALKEESKNEKKEEKKKDKEERGEKKRKDKDERKEEKKKDKEEKKEQKKKEKKLSKAARQEEKDKRELKRKLRQIRHERESATAMERLQNCLNAEFIADASIPDETVLKGEQKFLKRWIVKNKGRRWNARTVLQCVEGNIIVASGENMVEVPFLKPDEQGELAVPFIAPAAPGHYESKWQLCHHSIPFGPLFWCQIIVEGDKVECEVALKEKSTEPVQFPSHDNTSLVNSAFPEDNTTPVRKLVEHIVPQGVVTEEADDASGSEAYLSSEDTADYDKIRMPLESVLMASQAAQAAELEWDAAGCTLDAESCNEMQIEELMVGTNEDAEGDVESILSDVSDEFMVVPVPPCFDPEAPLTADPAQVTVSVTEYKQMSESHQGPFSLNLSGHTSLEAELKSGPASVSYTGQRIVSSVETTLEVGSDIAERNATSVELTLEAASSTGQRDVTSTETKLEMTSRTTTEENSVFDLANETVPQLPEPLIPESGLHISVTMEAPLTDRDPNELNLPITHEPLPAPEPAQDDDNIGDNDDYDDDDDDDDVDDDHDGPAQPEVSSQPIAAQPVSGTDEPPPVALQPEPSTPVNVAPTTIRTTTCRGVVQHIPNTSNDFPSNVVADVLSTAIDAVASAGRAVITTVDNLFTGPKPQATATYNPEQGCDISVSPPSEITESSQDSPEVHPVTWPPGRSPATCLDCLMEMGFCDRKLNEQLLKKHNNNVALVVNELLSFTDNEWSTRRH